MDKQGLYIQLFSIHGLIRGQAPELGRDADTGGQIKYVIEMARALALRDDVDQVDLITRRIRDKNQDSDYDQEIEPLSNKARIIRIQCGGRKYIRKELLWPHLEEFIDKCIGFITQHQRIPDLFHGHYADGGYVAMELAAAFDAPFIFTGHSLGRSKQAKLLSTGLNQQQINRQYHMATRIEVEEEIISQAKLIITSTDQEASEQYGLYQNGKNGQYAVIPPGIDLETFYPYYNFQLDPDLINEETRQVRLTLLNELNRFWSHPDKPFILALCRPDQRKNICGLIEAYGTNPELKALANLAVFAGLRQDINTMGDNEKGVLTDMLLQMDRYDLYGKLAIPKQHDFSTEVPELYRLCAEHRGVFVNPALIEPFGLTLIEASACGLPIIATSNGGPVDIVANCKNGILVDVSHSEAIAQAIHTILIDPQQWSTCSNNGISGVRKHYAWGPHCEKVMSHVHQLLPSEQDTGRQQLMDRVRPSFGKRLTHLQRIMISDIDYTLIGDDNSLLQLLQLLEESQADLAWGVATGRSLELTLEAMTEYNIPLPDILICSVGTEIYYGPDLRKDKGWQQHISAKWRPELIKETLNKLEFLIFQEAEGQRSHKISYYMEDIPGQLDTVQQALTAARLRCQVIYSHGQFLDILPFRASKGKAINYLKYKYKFRTDQIMVAGDSGNDTDMLQGNNYGLVVGNHSPELDRLKGKARIHFSRENYAAGIIDGLYHYGFLPAKHTPGPHPPWPL
ncbi:MAG: HAD-IIB family hydrolase [Desulfobulbaceae bacterium]|uniref:sucrose-phosphate synthase n=1 Tax=Candidatus Desulfatifera sulfidica TaxID=2841691 RepID=A0A8J6N5W2_9BACT|nr:HAD-IIB family hydrolase [Candidatus Desulfatifera sulfidica]